MEKITHFWKKSTFSIFIVDPLHSDEAETLGILGHLDVVPTGDSGWNNDPFCATIKGNRLYARNEL